MTNGSGKQIVHELLKPKDEILDYDLPDDLTFSGNLGDNAASTSGRNLRLDLVGMGFPPPLVDRVIEEKGEDNAELLVETLLAYSAPCKSESPDSADVLFSDDMDTCMPKASLEEDQPDVFSGFSEKKTSLLRMRFSVHEVESAMKKLGKDAAVADLVDFILAAQMADNRERGATSPVLIDLEKDQVLSTEALFGTMEKTLKLLEIGFSEQEVSIAIEKYGSDLPVSELAASIVAEQCGEKYILPAFRRIRTTTGGYHSIDSFVVKKEEEEGLDDDVSLGNLNFVGKRPLEEGINEPSDWKRPKQECDEELDDYFSPAWFERRQRNTVPFANEQMSNVQFKDEQLETYALDNLDLPNSCRTLSEVASKRPYFFYGNLSRLSRGSWAKVSQFLFLVQPEFINTGNFSALSRQEGYVHNLPTENRFHALPKPPMIVEEAIPRIRKWKPLWDTRKKLSCINSEIAGLPQLCERLGKLLHNSKGLLSSKQKEEFLYQCQLANLVWVGHHELAPIEPEQLELILGYPTNHTRVAGSSLSERLLLLGNCFQIDTLAYHLSVLKPCFTGGVTLLSIYSGIGGAEIALHRLGVPLKVVVSVEPSESKRRILKRWWENQGKRGELVQIDSIQKLSSSKLEDLMKKYGVFDFVFCQDLGSNSLKSSNLARGGKGTSDFDFQMFYEFVRVLQCVRRSFDKSR